MWRSFDEWRTKRLSMYITGEDVPTDKPRAMAWVAIAAERGDQHYVAARELAYSELTPEELAKANEIWRDLKNTYAPSLKRWSQAE